MTDDAKARRRDAEAGVVQVVRSAVHKGMSRGQAELFEEIKAKLKNETVAESISTEVARIIKRRNGVDGVGLYTEEGHSLFRDFVVEHEDDTPKHQEQLYEFFGRASRTILRNYWTIIADAEHANSPVAERVGLPFCIRLQLFSPDQQRIRYLTIRHLVEDVKIYIVFISWDMKDYSNSSFVQDSQLVVDLIREKLGVK